MERHRAAATSSRQSEEDDPGDAAPNPTPLTVDYFEALAVIPAPDGAVKPTVASDDNFRPFQRALLMALLRQPEYRNRRA